MNKIQIKILNPLAILEVDKMMVCAARLTQRAHSIDDINDFMDLYNKSYTENTIKVMSKLPHPTIQKFGIINIVVLGASRRFLAQITRHQNEVKFMSGSLQYSNYKDCKRFVIPYNLLDKPDLQKEYLEECYKSMNKYNELNSKGLDNDSCGYISPQSLRNVLIISATPYQWKHMIAQRVCRRNSDETRYVMLKIWEQLYELEPNLFSIETTGPFCCQGQCKEGKMSCVKPIKITTPTDLLKEDFPLCEVKNEN